MASRRVYFDRVRLKNVRCFRDAEIPLDDRVTVIVGGNASGKTTLICKDRQPRSFRFQLRPGYSQPPAAISRAVADAAKARREAERIFGPLDWQDASGLVHEQNYVVQVATCQTR